jgi:hypothetical protein
MIVCGTADTFDTAAFSLAMALLLVVDPSRVSVQLSAGSVLLVVSVVFAVAASAESAAQQIEAMPSSALSASLGVSIEPMVPPSISIRSAVASLRASPPGPPFHSTQAHSGPSSPPLPPQSPSFALPARASPPSLASQQQLVSTPALTTASSVSVPLMIAATCVGACLCVCLLIYRPLHGLKDAFTRHSAPLFALQWRCCCCEPWLSENDDDTVGSVPTAGRGKQPPPLPWSQVDAAMDDKARSHVNGLNKSSSACAKTKLEAERDTPVHMVPTPSSCAESPLQPKWQPHASPSLVSRPDLTPPVRMKEPTAITQSQPSVAGSQRERALARAYAAKVERRQRQLEQIALDLGMTPQHGAIEADDVQSAEPAVSVRTGCALPLSQSEGVWPDLATDRSDISGLRPGVGPIFRV